MSIEIEIVWCVFEIMGEGMFIKVGGRKIVIKLDWWFGKDFWFFGRKKVKFGREGRVELVGCDKRGSSSFLWEEEFIV